MDKFDRIERLFEIHKLILNKTKGTPDELAKKFSISRAGFYNILEELKDYGAIIKYCKKYNYFYYCNDFEIEIKILKINNKNTSVQGN